MRIFNTFLFLLSFSCLLKAQNTEGGITFIRENFKEALAKAKAANKTVFVDAYTVWCGPCKMMVKNVFPEKSVSDFYNQQFVNLTMDMEKGEGPELAQKYGISAYPTLLFLDGEGQLVHKAVGYHDAKDFLEVGKTALMSDKSLSSWTSKYDKGNREAQFLKDYALKLAELFDNRRFEVADEYLKTQQEWTTPDNIEFIYRFTEGVDSKQFPFFIKNKKAFESKYPASEIEVKIQSMVSDRLFNEKNLPTLGFADSIIALVYSAPKAKRTSKNYRMSYYRMKGDREKYAKSAIEYFKKFNDSAEELSDVANTFHEQIGDRKMLKKAIKWAKKAVKLDNSYINNLTLAQLYQDVEKVKDAKKATQKAIEIAKINGETVEEAEALMKELDMPKTETK